MADGINHRNVVIKLETGERTSGILSVPETRRGSTGVIVAHGAGNDMTNPFIAAFAEGVSRAGYPVLRFNFLYMDRGRKSPDPEAMLVAAWRAASDLLLNDTALKVDSFIAAGKSMGGRIASQMVAAGQLSAKRLVFLGYPLHRAGDPTRLRDAHLYEIGIPMLFIEGTRDTLCDLSALAGVLERLKAPYDLYKVEGGDHSFHVPKSAGVSEGEIQAGIVGKTLEWLSRPVS